MSLSTECKSTILGYLPVEVQLNAALSGEHREYVEAVLILLRDLYRNLNESGATSYVVPSETHTLIMDLRPW